jgi:hypothetical protein
MQMMATWYQMIGHEESETEAFFIEPITERKLFLVASQLKGVV